MLRACKLFRPTFPFAVPFSPFHRPLLVLLFIFLSCFCKVLSAERNSKSSNDLHLGITFSEAKEVGRYQEEGSAISDNQEDFLENEASPSSGDYDNIESIDESRDDRSLFSVGNRKDSMDSTNENMCRVNVCATKVETEKNKEDGFPVTIFNLVTDVNITDETAEAPSNEPPFVGFEGSQKFPIKVQFIYNCFI